MLEHLGHKLIPNRYGLNHHYTCQICDVMVFYSTSLEQFFEMNNQYFRHYEEFNLTCNEFIIKKLLE